MCARGKDNDLAVNNRKIHIEAMTDKWNTGGWQSIKQDVLCVKGRRYLARRVLQNETIDREQKSTKLNFTQQ